MKTVIILDDDHTYLSLLQRAVKMEKLENSIILVRSAQEFRVAVESTADVGLALLDINLGDGDSGLDLVAWIRKDLSERKIVTVLQSWTTELPDQERARNLGSELRPKLKSFSELRQSLHSWLGLANQTEGPSQSL